MEKLAIWLTSWKRPHFLKKTLESIAKHNDVLNADLFIVDNGSCDESKEIIKSSSAKKYWLLDENKGINWPVENLLPGVLDHRLVLFCDHDSFQMRSLSTYARLLDARSDVGAATGVCGPEWPMSDSFTHDGLRWLLKRRERGGCAMVRAETLLSCFPLPKTLVGFDSHIMDCLVRMDLKVAVLPRGVIHLGWRLGDSTWQDIEIPELFVLDGFGRVVEKR